MYMSYMVSLNWGNIPDREYVFGLRHLISGETAAGKTSLLDAVQTIMTATRAGLYEFNPGQTEEKSRKKREQITRSLEGYILGCDDGMYSRPAGAQGYIAMVFEPDEGEEVRPVTAVVCAAAQISGAGRLQRAPKLLRLLLLVCDGVKLHTEDFVNINGGISRLIPLDDIYAHLKANHGKGVIHEFADRKGHYLQKLYGAFRGRPHVSDAEAKFAAGAFSRFMAYKPIDSLDEFVFAYVLDPPEHIIDMARLVDMMREGNDLKVVAARLKNAAQQLSEIVALCENHAAAWLEIYVFDLAIAHHRETSKLKELSSTRSAEIDLVRTLADAKMRMEQLESEASQYEEQLRHIDSKLLGHIGYRTYQPLKARQNAERSLLDEALKAYDNAKVTLECSLHALSQACRLELPDPESAEFIEQFEPWREVPIGLASMLSTSAKLLRSKQVTLPMVVACENALQGLAEHMPTADSLFELLTVLKSTLQERHWQLNAEVAQVQQALESKQSEIDDLVRRDKLQYPPEVISAIELLTGQFPQANVRLLCEDVEVRTPAWQAAIEGFLGDVRFSIFVPEAFELQAVLALKKAGLQGAARIIETSVVRTESANVAAAPQSICAELRCRSVPVEAFLKLRFGNVFKVVDAKGLKTHRRGLTQDGLAVDGYTLFSCLEEDRKLVFGQHARRHRLACLHQELLEIASRKEQLEARKLQIQNAIAVLGKVARSPVAQCLAVVRKHVAEITAIDEELALIDLSQEKELTRKHDKLMATINHNKLSSREAQVAIAKLMAALSTTQNRVGELVEEVKDCAAVRQDAAGALARLSEFDSSVDFALATSRAKDVATSRQLTITDIESMRAAAASLISSLRLRITTSIGTYNQGSDGKPFPCGTLQTNSQVLQREDTFSTILYLEIRLIVATARQIYKQVQDTHLPDTQEQIDRASAEFNKAFTRDLCQIIVNDIKSGEARLNHLTNVLANKQFGHDDTFSFKGEWKSDFTPCANIA